MPWGLVFLLFFYERPDAVGAHGRNCIEKMTVDFVNGKMRGHGTTVFPNGDRYVHETAEDGSKAGDYYAAGSKNSVYTRYDSNGIITN